MSPWDRIVTTYASKGVDLGAALDVNLQFGFVFSTPDFFIMGRPMGDTWFIEAMAGDMSRAWDILPYPLPYIAWQRFDNVLRKAPLSVVKRLTRHEIAKPMVAA